MSDTFEQLKAALADRYAIEQEVGSGGMATVYLARDLKHDRPVAVKVLRPELAAVLGAERFLREIKVTANLQHPHILPLHDSGEADSFLYYVMPYVEGESLRDKVNREKQLSIEESLEITKAVASALDYAHRHDVIHRDVKPENILMHDGQALVADFGIALAVSAAGGTRLTETGLSLGTPHYMSPEQAMGDREVDARSDVYSLGAMLYEMLAGDPPHTGSTAQAIVAKVITEKAVPVTRHRDTVPRHVAGAIHKALSKLPADRFPNATSFAEALVRPALADTDDYAVVEAGAAERAKRIGGSRRVMVAGFVATMAAGIAMGWWLHPTSSGQRAVTRVVITLRPSPSGEGFGPWMAISSDGRHIAYVGGGESPTDLVVSRLTSQRLFVRFLGALSSTEIPGSVGAYTPFFSPNGRWVGFIVGDKLMKVPVAGGTPVLVAEITGANVRGASWGSNDVIVYSPAGISSLMRVSAEGGVPEPVTSSDGGEATVGLRWPAMLPDGDAALVTLMSGTLHDAEIGVVSLESGIVKRLGAGVGAQYAAGHIVFAQADVSGSLLAAPFDLRALEITGPVVPVEDGVRVYGGGASQYAISRLGTLIFQPIDHTNRSLILVDRDGGAELLSPEFRPFEHARFSPDGIRVAMTIADGNDRDVWIYDLEQGTFSRLTTIGGEFPSWTPDGAQVTFDSNRRGPQDLYWRPWDGSAPAEPLVTGGGEMWSSSWSADGRSLFFRQTHLATGEDIMMISLDGDESPEPFLVAEHGEIDPAPSPDDRWVAYASDESGQWEVYVHPYHARGGRIPVSRSGGTGPVWAPSGRELFYLNGDSLMVARVETENAFRVLSRTLLFRRSFVMNGFDVHPDGNKFLMLRDEEESRKELVIVFNWFEELRNRMAALGGEDLPSVL